LKLVFTVKHYLGANAFFFFTTCMISTVGAHPGHGEEGGAHYLMASEHAFPLLVGFALFALLVLLTVRGRLAKWSVKR